MNYLQIKEEKLLPVVVELNTLLADYLLSPDRRSHKLDDLALIHLNHKMISYEEVTGKKGPSQLGFEQVEILMLPPDEMVGLFEMMEGPHPSIGQPAPAVSLPTSSTSGGAAIPRR